MRLSLSSCLVGAGLAATALGYGTTIYITVDNCPATSTSSPALPVATTTPVYLYIIQSAPRKVRDLSSQVQYIGAGGNVTTNSQQALPFNFTAAGQLISNQSYVSTSGLVTYQAFAPSIATGNISTTFAISSNGTVAWTNLAFANGRASFCLRGLVLDVYFGLPISSDCQLVSLGAVPVINVLQPSSTSVPILTGFNPVPGMSSYTFSATTTTNSPVSHFTSSSATQQASLNNILSIISSGLAASSSSILSTISSGLATSSVSQSSNGTYTASMSSTTSIFAIGLIGTTTPLLLTVPPTTSTASTSVPTTTSSMSSSISTSSTTTTASTTAANTCLTIPTASVLCPAFNRQVLNVNHDGMCYEIECSVALQGQIIAGNSTTASSLNNCVGYCNLFNVELPYGCIGVNYIGSSNSPNCDLLQSITGTAVSSGTNAARLIWRRYPSVSD